MEIRRFQPGEESRLWRLLHATVHRVNARDYSPAQLEAWAPEQCNLAEWRARLQQTQPLVAEVNGELVGFTELEANGHINCFYSAYDWQGKGVGSALLEAVENEAIKLGMQQLFAEVSITAKHFFLNKGFALDVERTVQVRNEQLINYVMIKQLSS